MKSVLELGDYKNGIIYGTPGLDTGLIRAFLLKRKGNTLEEVKDGIYKLKYDFDVQNDSYYVRNISDLDNFINDLKKVKENGNALILTNWVKNEEKLKYIDEKGREHILYDAGEKVGHSIYIVDILDDRFVIANWGKRMFVKYEELKFVEDNYFFVDSQSIKVSRNK